MNTKTFIQENSATVYVAEAPDDCALCSAADADAAEIVADVAEDCDDVLACCAELPACCAF